MGIEQMLAIRYEEPSQVEESSRGGCRAAPLDDVRPRGMVIQMIC